MQGGLLKEEYKEGLQTGQVQAASSPAVLRQTRNDLDAAVG